LGYLKDGPLSALWFCLAVHPVSDTLNETGCGYQIRSPLAETHGIYLRAYMNDLQVYVGTQRQLIQPVKIAEIYTTE
jgi:hypothetical protein